MPEVNDRSDWGSSDDNDGQYEEFDEDDDPVPSFADIPNKKRFNLSVHGTYTNWGPREAFRELVQNWYGHRLLSTFSDQSSPTHCHCLMT